jgi:chemotaxis protein methyltransferase CheR
MLVAESSFFAEFATYQTLRDRVVPALVERRRADRALHCWSPACGSGQDPYSLALMIRDHFPELADWKVRILGSDVSRSILERAREGRYTQLEVNRGLPARMMVKYFEKIGSDWKLRDAIRGMVEFRLIDLEAPLPALPPMDLILLDAALRDADAVTDREVVDRLGRTLRAGGCLVLGRATALPAAPALHPEAHGRVSILRRAA